MARKVKRSEPLFSSAVARSVKGGGDTPPLAQPLTAGYNGRKCGARWSAKCAVYNFRTVKRARRPRRAGGGRQRQRGEGREYADAVAPGLPSRRSGAAGTAPPLGPQRGQGAGGDMGEKPTPPEGRQRPHAARHGPKRAGAQPGRSGRRPRTPPPARPERPEAARPPGKAAGTAGARHGGDPRKRPGPQAGPSAAQREAGRGAGPDAAARRVGLSLRNERAQRAAFLLLDTRTLFRQSRSA